MSDEPIEPKLGSELDLPYEPAPPGQSQPLGDDTIIAGGIVVMAIVAPLAGEVIKPGLMFRFARADGTGFVTLAFIADDDQLAKVRPLVRDAVYGAIAGANRARRE